MKLNEVRALALPYINPGEEPDAETLARQVGFDPESSERSDSTIDG